MLHEKSLGPTQVMAAEVGVDVTSLEELEKSRNPSAEPSPTSHEDEIDSASTLREPLPLSHEELPIVYHYLLFETELPPTPVPLEHDALRPSPPPCPNLRSFENPFLWSKTRKSFMTWLSCLITVSAAYSSGSYIATADQLTREWGISNVAYNAGITIFTVGFGIAPMALAPLSEEYGRRPVFLVSGLLYVGKIICSCHVQANLQLITLLSLPIMLCFDPIFWWYACSAILRWSRRL
jgi:hypothetical protein